MIGNDHSPTKIKYPAQGVRGLILCAFCFEKLWEIELQKTGHWSFYPAQTETPPFEGSSLCPYCGETYVLPVIPEQAQVLVKDQNGHLTTWAAHIKRRSA